MDFIVRGFRDKNFEDYSVTLIDCNKDTMIKRLEERGQPELATEQMFGWLNYLRKQAISYGFSILDNSNSTIDETLKNFLNII